MARGYSLAGEAPLAPPFGRIDAASARRGGGWRPAAVSARAADRACRDRSSQFFQRRGDRARCPVRAAPARARTGPRRDRARRARAGRAPAAAVAAARVPSARRSAVRWPAAGLAVGLSLPALPLSAIARRRGDRGRARHAVLARLGRRPASRAAAIESVLAAGGRRAAVARHEALSAPLVAAGVGRLGAVRRRPRGAGAGRARPGLQRLHAAARGPDALRRARARRARPGSRWGRCTRSTPAGARPRPTRTWPGSARPSGSCCSTRCSTATAATRSASSSRTSWATCATATCLAACCTPRWSRRPPRWRSSG